jgi:hypothetical protein
MTALASDKPLNDARHAVVITLPDLGSMCGRRLIEELFYVDAALVGCGHVSGLLMRRGRPLALMLYADQVPIRTRAFEDALTLAGSPVSALRRRALANSYDFACH